MEKKPVPSEFRDSNANLEHLREQHLKLMAEIEANGRKILEKVGAKYYVILCKGGYFDQPGYNNVERQSDKELKEYGREDEINKQRLQVLVYDKAIPDEYGDTDEDNLPAAEIGTVSPTLTEEAGVYLNSAGTEVIISTKHTEDADGPYPTYTNKIRARIVDGKINNANFAKYNVGLFATQEEAQVWAKTKMEEAARALQVEYSRKKHEK
jgi:hypothetical protein